MTNTPSKVSIGGVIIAIRVEPGLESWGEYRSDDREIVLASRTLEKRQTLRETLRHEMLHASLDICGLSHLKNYEEEAIVRCVDTVFHPAWDKLREQL